MRWFLSLCFVGLLAYALLPPRTEPLQNVLQEADTGLSTSETVAAKAAKRELRSSWGSTLRSLKPTVQAAQKTDTQPPLQHRPRSAVRQPEPAVNKADAPAPEAQVIGAVTEPALWARVSFAARAHSEASVSSPVVKFYPAGTELQVVAQQGAWIQLRDPATSERGWVFNKYLVSIGRPSAAQPALASGNETQPTDAADVQVVRDSEPAVAPKTVEVTREARRKPRWVKRQERRERKRRRLFGRNAGPAAWSLGSR